MPYGSLARRTIGYVRLARYNVTINLGVASISKEDYMENADTLSLCLFNLFHDGYLKTTYRKLLDKSYAYKQPITRQIDSRQLERMKEFPLIAEMDSLHGFTIKQIEDEYKVGLEGSFDRLLRGRDGTRLIQKMGAGAWKVVSDENLVEPMNGLDIHTSIDVNLQDVAENALRKSLDSNSAEWGCCVLMEVKTGLIKAIANLQRDKDGVYYENLNNAVRQQIEPGSTFKLASVIAILEDGAHDTGTIVPTGTGKVGHRIVNDAYPAGYGYVSLSKAFEKSSNRGISTLTYEVFREKVAKFKEYIVKMGLANALGIELAGEPEPQMKIRLKDLETIPYGYVVKLTPLQILAFYNAVANNGTYVRPRFVESVGRAGETLYTTQTKVLEKAVCSQKTLAKVRKLLEGVVESGTATALKKAACKVAGKTGTARIYSDTGYVNKYVASFAGYFPAEKPEYSCIVVIYGTSGNEYSGSQVSAPVFMEVADKVYASRLDLPAEKRVVRESRPPLANVAYQRDLSVIYGLLNFKVVSADVNATWAVCSPKGNYVEVKPKTLSKERIPDVSGMSARDAVYLLESRGLLVTAKGVGDVVSQQPLAGSPYKMGDKVQLQLSMQEK
jgi:cell division protein FtsI (penicillin-binding protein 3)